MNYITEKKNNKKINDLPVFLTALLCMTVCANGYELICGNAFSKILFIILFVAGNTLTLVSKIDFPTKLLRITNHGNKMLKIFCLVTAITIVLRLVFLPLYLPGNFKNFLFSLLCGVIVLILCHANGILSVYLTSVQLGITSRVIGILVGFIPIVNLIMLGRIIHITSEEVTFETQKHIINKRRKQDRLCQTRYPLLLVHGVFFRDSAKLCYWGRIPDGLEKNGAKIYFGQQQSASSIKDSGEELAKRIKEIVNKTGCGKVNIIAHSKGGLDCRYAIEHCGISDLVASLTTINTPHRGCNFADHLLNEVDTNIQKKVALAYNAALRKLGDKNPDFMAAVRDLTSSYCTEFDKNTPKPEGIYCQSVGSHMKYAIGGKFPLNFSYQFVKNFDGENDGLVGKSSFEWGDDFTYITVKGMRGVSHADMIDLNRENIKDFDVREFYVQLVNRLKMKGL